MCVCGVCVIQYASLSQDWQACSTCYMSNRLYDKAFRLIREAHRLRRTEAQLPWGYSERGPDGREPSVVSIMKLEHDAEQLSHLYSEGRLEEDVPVEGA